MTGKIGIIAAISKPEANALAPEIAEWLETLARAEKSHAGRFVQGLEHIS